MGIPIDDEPLEPTDDAPVTTEVASADTVADDGEAPVADAVEQGQELSAGWRIGRRSSDPEAPVNDAVDQAIAVPDDDGDAWRD